MSAKVLPMQRLCPICEEDQVPAGKSLCPICEGIQYTMRTMPERRAVVLISPWDLEDFVITGSLAAIVLGVLYAIWAVFIA